MFFFFLALMQVGFILCRGPCRRLDSFGALAFFLVPLPELFRTLTLSFSLCVRMNVALKTLSYYVNV